MKIGLVAYGSLDLVSGGNLYDRKLVEHLSAKNHHVELVSLPPRGYLHALADNLRGELTRRVLAAAYDVLLEDELAHPSLFRQNHLWSRAGIPLVSIVHHLRSSESRPEWQNALYRRLERRYLASVDAFVYNSHTTRESVETLLGQKTRSVVAVPGGDRLGGRPSRARVEARAREDGPLRVLFVGNLIERKGLDVLLDALAETGSGVRLEVVGSLDREPAYVARRRRQIERLALTDRVVLRGPLDGDDLAARFRESHVLALPSSYEGFGIVFLEAMGFGLPVVAARAGATDEVVHHEATGFLVQPGDARSLAIQIDRLAGDRELLARMSAAALEEFETRPTWGASLEAIERFLRDVARTPDERAQAPE